MLSRANRKPAISVIIIALNEEKRLPKLLACLKQQTFRDFEVIVADANSKDKTRAIARAAKARVTQGGPVAVARNNGAKVAKGNVLVFSDADIAFDKHFLEIVQKEFAERKLDFATVHSKPDSTLLLSRFFYAFYGAMIWLTQWYAAKTPGHCILTRRELYDLIGGFDPRVQFEDLDYAQRARAVGRFGIISATVRVADRRFRPGNRLRTLYTLIRSETDRWLGIRKYHWYEYPFGEHPEQHNTGKRK